VFAPLGDEQTATAAWTVPALVPSATEPEPVMLWVSVVVTVASGPTKTNPEFGGTGEILPAQPPVVVDTCESTYAVDARSTGASLAKQT